MVSLTQNAHTLLLVFLLIQVCGCAKDKKSSPLKQDELLKLIQTIDNNPDPAYFSETPAVNRLIEVGNPTTIRFLLPLLQNKSIPTRLHARDVILGITQKVYGVPSVVIGRNKANEKWLDFWKSMGEYGPFSVKSEQETKEFTRKMENWINQWERDHK